MNRPTADQPDRPGAPSVPAEPPSSPAEPQEHDMTEDDGSAASATEEDNTSRTPRGGYQPL